MRVRDRKGSQVVEFALILPMLLLVVFGIVDFGLAIFDKAIVTNAAREAARAGVVFAPTRLTETEIQQVALNYCGSNLVTFGSPVAPNVAVVGAGGASGAPLQVTVSYPYTYGVIGRLVPLPSLTLTSQAVMRME
jgi:Flp pilus assembly protein TadG